MYVNKTVGNRNELKAVENQKVEELYPRLQQYCRFLSKNKWDGDDLAQEAVLKAVNFYHLDDISASLLNKIAYHQWVDTIRKSNHETLGIPLHLFESEDKNNPEVLMDTVEFIMKHLTSKQAVVFTLKEAFRYQAKEIAELLGTNETAVKSILHRARKRLEKENPLHVVDSNEEEQELLSDLLYESLQLEDPQILLDKIMEIPSLSMVAKPAKPIHSRSSLTPFCRAA